MKLKLKQILQERNMTRYRLAKLAGINECILYNIIQLGRNDMHLSTAYKIAKALNITIEDLIEGEEKSFKIVSQMATNMLNTSVWKNSMKSMSKSMM